MQLAPEFDAIFYKRANRDLWTKNPARLREHYERVGRQEGRVANQLRTRVDFVEQIPHGTRVLEIGPFANPMLVRPEVRYCDVLDRDQLRARARTLGLDPEKIPMIHYVLEASGLNAIPDTFDAVISSHSIEHQPDLIGHLQQIARRLDQSEGRYFALIPDKRYCFDRLIAPSTIADVIDAHESGRRVHSLRSVIEHRALTTHNDSARHWANAAPEFRIDAAAVRQAVEEWRTSLGAYVDVHAWYFTPDSFSEIVRLLQQLGYISFHIERLYPTRKNCNEFWAVLLARSERTHRVPI